MHDIESLNQAVLNLKSYYQQILENNQATIAKLQSENSLIEVQIHHADALLLGHQSQSSKALCLVEDREPITKKVAPNAGKARRNNGSNPPLTQPYQGMSVLAASTEVIKSKVGEILSIRDISDIIFLPHHSKKAQTSLRNLLSRELSRGVKEGRFFRAKMAGHYTWDLSKIEKASA
ncbi:hypothetical protein [Nostoc sp. DedQUE07]|uniref:hypothetical protein n=1 Tax=Nostoc sp. DedQUE07 TaxID=3075392 RepID=UPI002AD55721|nr:hypothetical protein [Nostoc sp. DedQUE07]MDZ8131853.1 hypothetical protein [Nostoc sp. DedQUE07]